MPDTNLTAYLERVRARHASLFFRDRHFQTAEEWSRSSAAGYRGWSLAGRQLALPGILENQAFAVLGEPGAGKSTVASASALVALDRGWIPLFASLREYKGDLRSVLRHNAPEDAFEPALTRLYILDGFDEVSDDHRDALQTEIENLTSRDRTARFLLTSRQAFFVGRETFFSKRWPAYYLEDLNNDDIDAFIAHHSVDRRSFRTALGASDLHGEATNPFVLTTLLGAFRSAGRLPATKAGAIELVIDETLNTRQTSEPHRKHRALRMLAVTMEIAATNELSLERAVQVLVQSIGEMDEARASRLLDDLSQMILIRTASGVSFQMRSFGEYLAAVELAATLPAHRILDLMLVNGRRELGPSWLNCITFLLETHSGFRQIMLQQFPENVVFATPTVFSNGQLRNIVRGVVSRFADRKELLLYHPVVRASRLAKFVQVGDLQELRVDLSAADEIRAANAAILLGAVGDQESAARIAEMAMDPNRSRGERHSALAEIGRLGQSDLVPRLLGGAERDDTTAMMRSAAVSLMSRDQFRDVIGAMAQSEGTISGAWERFEELTDPEDASALIDALLSVDIHHVHSRLSVYQSAIWRSIVRLWRPEWAHRTAELLVRSAQTQTYESMSKDIVEELVALPDAGESVGEAVIRRLITDRTLAPYLGTDVYRLVGADTVRALLVEGGADEVLRFVRAFARPEVRAILYPPQQEPGPIENDPAMVEIVRRRAEATERNEANIRRATEATSGADMLDALGRLDAKQWPDLAPQQLAILTPEVSAWLVRCDLRQRIVWTGPSTWQSPQALPVLLEAVDRYAFRVEDDRPLVWALMGFEKERIVRYFHRHGLSRGGLEEVVALLDDSSLPDPAIAGAIGFIKDAGIRGGGVVERLERIVIGHRGDGLREAAIDALLPIQPDDASVVALAEAVTGALRERLELALIDRGYRPTTERRLARLIDDPTLLAEGNSDSHFDNPLNWIGRIRSPDVWPKLVVLRRVALEREMGPVVDLLTSALGGIDLDRLANVVLEQVDSAPTEWRDVQRVRAGEYRRDAALRSAQGVPFEVVLQKLRRATTFKMFKVWTEGSHEIPALKVMVTKLPTIGGSEIVVDSLNGWGTVLSADWEPERLWDGCHDLAVLLDGDRARDYAAPGFPLKSTDPGLTRALSKMAAANIDYRILERYAFENYFPEHAFSAVVGVSAAASFPLRPDESVTGQMPAYNKSMNGALAGATALTDLASTDLGAFLDEVGQRAQ